MTSIYNYLMATELNDAEDQILGIIQILNQPFHLQAACPKILWRRYRILKSEMRKQATE